jgi:hypothetical protein
MIVEPENLASRFGHPISQGVELAFACPKRRLGALALPRR